MLEPRASSYLWPTWITGLLSGEDQCEWQAWLKAHFTYTKKPDDNPNGLSRWRPAHNDLVKQRSAELRQLGWTVTLEDQNKIVVRGNSTIGGQPDILATSKSQVLIVDCKTGSRKAKDLWQVRIYMLLVPFAKPQLCEGRSLLGEVEYPDGRVSVTCTAQDAARITEQVRLSGRGPEPKTSPSAAACRFCDIADCPDRVVVNVPAGEAGGLF